MNSIPSLTGFIQPDRLVAFAASAATATVAATAAAVSAATATGAIFTGLGFVDRQRAYVTVLAVQFGNRLRGFFRGGHFNERKAAGFTRELVGDEAATLNRAARFEQLAKIAFRGVERQVPYI